MAKFGLLRVQLAQQQTTTSPMIRESFRIIGQYPHCCPKCTSKFSSEQELSINANMDSKLKKIMKHSRLTTKDFNDLMVIIWTNIW